MATFWNRINLDMMAQLPRIFFMLLLVSVRPMLQAQPGDSRYFEMRTYTAHAEKRPDLIRRFKEHTLRLLAKHGIDNVAYFLPVDENMNTLTFVLAYPSRADRDQRWNQFIADPRWKRAAAKSEENGKLVAQVDQTFMHIAPELSAVISPNAVPRGQVFELRTYTCLPGRLPALKARFKDHTRALFAKHGMKNVVYWESVEAEGQQPKLLYLLSHSSVEAARASFDAFRSDSEWIAVRDASEADGKIVEKLESVFFKPLPFSPLK